MPRNYAQHYAKNGPTPQSQPIPGRETEMVKNSAGGFTFGVDDWARLDRFLIIGSEGNTYYASERKLSRQNAECVVRCLKQDGPRTVARIVEISDEGRAFKNDPALFALALAASSEDMETRQLALQALPKVARIGTHLYHFVDYVNSQRGWGRALKRAVGDWFNNRSIDSLANQALKYQQRDGWSARDLLRLSKPTTEDVARAATYGWMAGNNRGAASLPHVILAFEHLKSNPTAENAVEVIEKYRLPRECIPTELLNDPKVWKALLKDMKLGAMVRNLGKMTSIEVLKPLSTETNKVVEALGSEEEIQGARLHPVSILIAMKTYQQGRGDKGSLTWKPNQSIVDALDGGFYKAFKTVEPTGKRILQGLDVSGTMGAAAIARINLTARDASAALSLVTTAVEKQVHTIGFTGGSYGYYGSRNVGRGSYSSMVTELNISAKMRLDTVIKNISGLPFGSTDCALPMLYAMEKGLEVDAFIVYTDNETWAGDIQPSEALKQYRKKTGIPAKLIVVGMTATGFTIADPKDSGMLDVVGFDTATPQLIADFIRE